jgi:hypothetical protein
MLYLCNILLIYDTRSQLSYCWFLILYEDKIRNRCSKYPPPESVHIWKRLIADYRKHFKDLGAVASGLTDIKYIYKVYFYFQLALNTLELLNVVTDENLKDWVRGKRGGYTSKNVYGQLLRWNIFLILV